MLPLYLGDGSCSRVQSSQATPPLQSNLDNKDNIVKGRTDTKRQFLMSVYRKRLSHNRFQRKEWSKIFPAEVTKREFRS